MTEQEAIKWMNAFKNQGRIMHQSQEACELAINALEKQIAKKPVGLYKNICPSCSWHIVGSNQKYCSDCGQKLDSEV